MSDLGLQAEGKILPVTKKDSWTMKQKTQTVSSRVFLRYRNSNISFLGLGAKGCWSSKNLTIAHLRLAPNFLPASRLGLAKVKETHFARQEIGRAKARDPESSLVVVKHRLLINRHEAGSKIHSQKILTFVESGSGTSGSYFYGGRRPDSYLSLRSFHGSTKDAWRR